RQQVLHVEMQLGGTVLDKGVAITRLDAQTIGLAWNQGRARDAVCLQVRNGRTSGQRRVVEEKGQVARALVELAIGEEVFRQLVRIVVRPGGEQDFHVGRAQLLRIE